MNFLIVDDDRFVIEALKNGLHWEKLGCEHLYTANNITEAKRILRNYRIHLLLSDIDMPNGSGLDLLAWVRENYNNIPAIFLTNYADFTYVQKALELKSFYYFLKPIEYEKLENIILDATKEFRNLSNINAKNFWQSFIQNTTSVKSEEFQQFWQLSKENYRKDDFFLPVVFDLLPYSLNTKNQLKNHFADFEEQTEYLTKTFHAVFSDFQGAIAAFLMYNMEFCRYTAIFYSTEKTIPPALLMDCENFISVVHKQTSCTLNCFVGMPSDLKEFQGNFSNLCSMINNTVDINRQLVILGNYKSPSPSIEVFDAQLSALFLENRKYDAFLEYCYQYLRKLSKSNSLSKTSLTSFQIDVLNVLYAHLKHNSVLPNKLFQSESYHSLSRVSCRSVTEMQLYLKYMIYTAKDYLNTSNSGQSIAVLLKEYADSHYTEEIHTSDIADVFFIDSDYGSKLFKKEFGISFKNYIIQKRLETAKHLLLHTDLSINAISTSVGYENYSYFTRLFKKTMGITPIEYRANHSDAPCQNEEL